MRPTEPHARPLPWVDLQHVHESELDSSFEWSPELEDAFLLLLAKGYSVGRITSQNKPGWPTYADYLRKVGQDPEFEQNCQKMDSKRATSLVDFSMDIADLSRPATASADKIKIETAWRTAAALDPERFGNKAQIGVSGGLILAAGSLADLAAQAAQLHTNRQDRVTPGAQDALPSPDNIGAAEDAKEERALTQKRNVP